MIKTHGLSRLSDFLGERVVYRNLAVQDHALPSFAALCKELSVDCAQIPRKTDPVYGNVVALLLKKAQQLDHPGLPLRSLIFVGDTRLNDGQAYNHINQAGGFQGIAFIGSENQQPVEIKRDPGFESPLFLANRWSLLSSFEKICEENDIQLNKQCALVLDLDKTSLGARGRNDRAIDRARSQAAQDVIRSIAGNSFNDQLFQKSYQRFNQVEFHLFTTDNQDYVVYISLLAVMGVIDVEQLADEVLSGSLRSFAAFANKIQARQPLLPAALQSVQSEFYIRLQKNDPTPFKAFRNQEYINTITAMQTPKVISETMLASTICMTQEVREFALLCKQKGCLLFGLSDKPDEASLPPLELITEGWLPLHQVSMLVVSAA